MPNPLVSVGPVIGKVTDTTARVLVEVNKDATLSATLTDPGGQAVQAVGVFRKSRPGVLRFTGLRPETTYSLSIQGADSPVASCLRTYSTTPTALNVGAVSCNYPPWRQDTDLWADLRDRYVRPGVGSELDLLLHLGDQVYQDDTFAAALALLGGKLRGTPAQERKILEAYRAIYRLNWAAHQPTRDVLANVPSLMIWDDHEITDDWGSFPAHSTPETPEYYVGTLARRVYREYQRQLWDDFDVDADPAGGLEHHFHKWGGVGVLFVDQRGGRSFGRDSARPYLSVKQWEEISTSLSAGGFFSSCRALLVVTSVPLAYLGDVLSTLGSKVPMANDLMDHWAWGPHRKEQIEMVRALREWKEAGNGTRELLVLGGDVHVGGRTDILRSGTVVFKQLITSPITNKPPGPIAFLGLRTLLEMDDGLGETYEFEHEDLTRRRSYGIVMVRIPPTGTPRVEGSLVEAT